MIPCRSTALPIMKPGTSARNTSGIPKASHSQMKRAALSAESTNSTPPFHFGWLATMPIGRPSRRAKPVTSSRANSFLSSKKLPSSTSASIDVVDAERLVLVGGEDVVDPLRARLGGARGAAGAGASPGWGARWGK